ncbi:MAG: NAD(P)H-dependent oxidoreductase [Planctomycetota bacterium]
MHALIVHAHPEPKSFSSALAETARASLDAAGHDVTLLDLYRSGFDPVSDRRNFTTAADSSYFKQQQEESHASEHAGFVPELDAAMSELERADLLIFSFPLWWFGMPAMLKGWVDRVFAYGRIYGGPKLYENGVGRGRSRAMVLMTSGGGEHVYSGLGVNPPLRTILDPIEHGVFWFNGFRPIDSFVAWSPARISQDERTQYLDRLAHRMSGIFDETPRQLAPLADFPNFGLDTKLRFLVFARRTAPLPRDRADLLAAEHRAIDALRHSGRLLSCEMSAPEREDWQAALVLRGSDEAEVMGWLHSLPTASSLAFDITELAALS